MKFQNKNSPLAQELKEQCFSELFRLAQPPLLFLTNTGIYVKTVNLLICYFSFREAKKSAEALTNSSENRQTFSMQAAESLEVEAKSLADDNPLPEPRLPYPFTSCLTEKEQKTYLYLMTKFSKKRNHFQVSAASQREFFTYMVRYGHHKGSHTIFCSYKELRKTEKKYSGQPFNRHFKCISLKLGFCGFFVLLGCFFLSNEVAL